jgi:hypothetical protein
VGCVCEECLLVLFGCVLGFGVKIATSPLGVFGKPQLRKTNAGECFEITGLAINWHLANFVDRPIRYPKSIANDSACTQSPED